MSSHNLVDKLIVHLSAPQRRVLEILIAAAERRRLPLYLVGGPVRDLLLNWPAIDLDVTVEGDAIALAREVGAALEAPVREHPPFQTATIHVATLALDLATARDESYHHPGALPTVRPASITKDLLRRDFSINAMALALNGKRRGEFLDPCAGLADLNAHLVRALHERSFIDDATRILRAIRYEIRFGFRLEENTRRWLLRDIWRLESISGSRVHHELSRILEEAEPEKALLRLEELRAPNAIYPAFSFNQEQAQAFRRLRRLAPEVLPSAYWPLLAWGLDEGQTAALAGRLSLTKKESAALTAMPRLRKLEPSLSTPDRRPSEVYEALTPFPTESLWAFAAATTGNIALERTLAFIRLWSRCETSLDGHDLLQLGVPAGPFLGETLRAIKNARLDGEVQSREDEERLARSLLQSIRRNG